MSRDFLIGLGVFPALALALTTIFAIRRWFRHRVQRLKGWNPRRTIPLAARLVVARRAFVWSTPVAAVAVVFGHHYSDQKRAMAVLLDEFLPIAEGEQ